MRHLSEGRKISLVSGLIDVPDWLEAQTIVEFSRAAIVIVHVEGQFVWR
jgi:hypothetical protein